MLVASVPPDPPVHLLLPLASSLLYVVGALLLKRSADGGTGVWRGTMICNWVIALFFMPLGIFMRAGEGPFVWYQPVAIGLLFLIGQTASIYALNRGDVSVATPVLGMKILFVAGFTTILPPHDRVSPKLWIAAGTSMLAITLLSRGGGKRAHHHVVQTIVSSVIAAASYAMFDVLIKNWSLAWGPGRLLPAVMLVSAAGSFVFLPLIKGGTLAVPHGSWKPLLGGSFFFSMQSLVLVTTIGLFGDATRVNVVYNARGLWSVLAVWLVGHWFASREQHLGKTVLRWRLAGAAIMLAAVVLALAGR